MDAPAWFENLLARQKPGFGLQREFYTSAEVFTLDLERIYGFHWLYVGHVSRLPERGSYFLFTVGTESIIVLRDREDEIRALYNVCRHRGSHLCLEPEGSVERLVCPYHAWVYQLDGRLVPASVRRFGIDPAAYPLRRCHVRVVEGLIFLSMADEPPDFEDFAQDVRHWFGPHHFEWMRCAHRERYDIAANWKIVSDNTLECYHCPVQHPELTSVLSFIRSTESPERLEAFNSFQKSWSLRSQRLGLPVGERDYMSSGGQYRIGREGIRPDMCTVSLGGQPVAPLLGDFREYDGGLSRLMYFPMLWIAASNDYVLLARFTPLSAERTEAELRWMVHESAIEGANYDPERLLEVYRATMEQDARLCEMTQAGVRSRAYLPGPYVTEEPMSQSFGSWYLRQMKQHVDGPSARVPAATHLDQESVET